MIFTIKNLKRSEKNSLKRRKKIFFNFLINFLKYFNHHLHRSFLEVHNRDLSFLLDLHRQVLLLEQDVFGLYNCFFLTEVHSLKVFPYLTIARWVLLRSRSAIVLDSTHWRHFSNTSGASHLFLSRSIIMYLEKQSSNLYLI